MSTFTKADQLVGFLFTIMKIYKYFTNWSAINYVYSFIIAVDLQRLLNFCPK